MRRWSTLAVAAGLAVAACGSATASPAVAPSNGASTPSPLVAASEVPSVAAASPSPGVSAWPSSLPRPDDLPLDGSCDEGHTCLGVIAAGKHAARVFEPSFTFTMPEDGWENLIDAGGVFPLHLLDHPGDGIFFFGKPRPTTSSGRLVGGVDTSPAALAAWLAADEGVAVTKPEPVTIGGLDGLKMDVTVDPAYDTHAADCETKACVSFMAGTDRTTWEWDWGVATGEKERLYLLDAGKDTVVIAVDSLDGTDFDHLTDVAGQVFDSLTFSTS